MLKSIFNTNGLLENPFKPVSLNTNEFINSFNKHKTAFPSLEESAFGVYGEIPNLPDLDLRKLYNSAPHYKDGTSSGERLCKDHRRNLSNLMNDFHIENNIAEKSKLAGIVVKEIHEWAIKNSGNGIKVIHSWTQENEDVHSILEQVERQLLVSVNILNQLELNGDYTFLQDIYDWLEMIGSKLNDFADPRVGGDTHYRNNHARTIAAGLYGASVFCQKDIYLEKADEIVGYMLQDIKYHEYKGEDYALMFYEGNRKSDAAKYTAYDWYFITFIIEYLSVNGVDIIEDIAPLFLTYMKLWNQKNRPVIIRDLQGLLGFKQYVQNEVADKMFLAIPRMFERFKNFENILNCKHYVDDIIETNALDSSDIGGRINLMTFKDVAPFPVDPINPIVDVDPVYIGFLEPPSLSEEHADKYKKSLKPLWDMYKYNARHVESGNRDMVINNLEAWCKSDLWLDQDFDDGKFLTTALALAKFLTHIKILKNHFDIDSEIIDLYECESKLLLVKFLSFIKKPYKNPNIYYIDYALDQIPLDFYDTENNHIFLSSIERISSMCEIFIYTCLENPPLFIIYEDFWNFIRSAYLSEPEKFSKFGFIPALVYLNVGNWVDTDLAGLDKYDIYNSVLGGPQDFITTGRKLILP